MRTIFFQTRPEEEYALMRTHVAFFAGSGQFISDSYHLSGYAKVVSTDAMICDCSCKYFLPLMLTIEGMTIL